MEGGEDRMSGGNGGKRGNAAPRYNFLAMAGIVKLHEEALEGPCHLTVK